MNSTTAQLDWAIHANRILRLEDGHLTVIDRIDKGLNMIGGLKQLFDQAEENNTARFAAVNERLDGVDKRLDSLDGRLDSIDGRLDTVGTRFDAMDAALREILSVVSK